MTLNAVMSHAPGAAGSPSLRQHLLLVQSPESGSPDGPTPTGLRSGKLTADEIFSTLVRLFFLNAAGMARLPLAQVER